MSNKKEERKQAVSSWYGTQYAEIAAGEDVAELKLNRAMRSLVIDLEKRIAS